MRKGSIVALLGIGLVAGGVATAVALIPTWLPVDASREAGRIVFVFWSSWAGPGYYSSRRRTTYVDDGTAGPGTPY